MEHKFDHRGACNSLQRGTTWCNRLQVRARAHKLEFDSKQSVVFSSLTTYVTDLQTGLKILILLKAVSSSMWIRMKGRKILLVRYGSRHELKGCVTVQSTFLEDHKLCVASHQLCRSRTSQDTLADLDLHKTHSPAAQIWCQAQRSACNMPVHMPWINFCPKSKG